MNASARTLGLLKGYCSAELDSSLRVSTAYYRKTSSTLSGPGVYDRPGAVSLASLGAVELRYRPDIDGLRAIAVVSVILFHAYPTLVPGGFVGVDVFFVISGFLITSLILDNLNKKKFSAVDFYARRIKRIFPCLILMLASCLALGWLNMLPNEFQLLGKHVFAGAGFWTNITLNNEAGYFDAAATQKPLLHLWSLAIEEQFYLIWPLIVILAWRWRRRVLPAIVSIAIISWAINLLRIDSDQLSTFYLLPTRGWELMAGAGLIWIAPGWEGIFSNRLHRIASELASAGGLLLVFAAIALLDSKGSFPGWRAMLPVTGTMLLIGAGPSATINRVLLSHPISVAIGLISYPLYLWHWPALVFPQIVGIGSATSRIISITIASMLAVATFRFVERKIRPANQSLSVILLGMMALVGGLGLSANLGILQAASTSQGLDDITAAVDDYVYPANVAAPVPYDGQTFWKIGSGRESIVFLGDSNAEQYFTRVRNLAHEAGQSVVFATNGGCPPILTFYSGDVPRCKAFIPAAFHFAEMSPAKTVVIAAQWFGYFSKASGATERSRFYVAIRQEVAELRSRGKVVFVVLNIPVGAAFAPTSKVTRHFFSVKLHGSGPVPETIDADSKSVSDSLKRIARETHSISIDPFDFLCSNGFCLTADKFGHPAYKDGYHLRAEFVRNSANFIDQVFSTSCESQGLVSRKADKPCSEGLASRVTD